MWTYEKYIEYNGDIWCFTWVGTSCLFIMFPLVYDILFNYWTCVWKLYFFIYLILELNSCHKNFNLCFMFNCNLWNSVIRKGYFFKLHWWWTVFCQTILHFYTDRSHRRLNWMFITFFFIKDWFGENLTYLKHWNTNVFNLLYKFICFGVAFNWWMFMKASQWTKYTTRWPKHHLVAAKTWLEETG